MAAARARLTLLVAAGLSRLLPCHTSCLHEVEGVEPPDASAGQAVVGNYTVLEDGRPASSDISVNRSKLYYYENFNVTTMNQPERYRKLIISLEPCAGVVYLFVRKTRRCWPDPHSCCQPLPGSPGAAGAPPCDPASQSVKCAWTHLHSVVDGSRDGAPSFFEVPHASTKYFIAVFAPSEVNLNHAVVRPMYRLTVLADVGAYPRPGLQGGLQARLAGERALEVSWQAATFIPVGVSGIRSYHVYSSLLLDTESKVNDAVVLSPSKVMNSVCGLGQNAVRYGSPLGPASCLNGICRGIISDMVPRRRYMLNIVAESHRGLQSAYSGIIVSSDWSETRSAFSGWSETTRSLVGAIIGTVFGVLGIGYLWIVKLYK